MYWCTGLLTIVAILIFPAKTQLEGIFPSDGRTISSITHPQLYRSVQLAIPFSLYGRRSREIYIHSTGIISFGQPVLEPLPKNLGELDNDYFTDFIAVFWAHSDLSMGGSVNYWVVDTSHIRITQAIRRTIRQAFPESEVFTVESAVVVSWEGIGYWQNGTDKVNTFHCALATNGTWTFALLYYPQSGIVWTAGDDHGGTNGIFLPTDHFSPLRAGVAGFHDRSYDRDFELPYSGTFFVHRLSEMSNVDTMGLHIYRTDGKEIIVPDPCLSQPCNVNAVCTREGMSSERFTCQCLPDFPVGNGIECAPGVNPCWSNPCDDHAVCTPIPDTEEFVCTCQPPHTQGDGYHCEVPNPCRLSPCHPEARCHRGNVHTAEYQCACSTSHRHRGSCCHGPNPCSSSPCQWDQLCVPGENLADYQCIQEVPDPCKPHPCHSQAHCVREGLYSSKYSCTCVLPLIGHGDQCTEPQGTSQQKSLRMFASIVMTLVTGLALILGTVVVCTVGIWKTKENAKVAPDSTQDEFSSTCSSSDQSL